jgi:glutathione S-transferase
VDLRVWSVPYSTNVERVSIALAHKGLEAEWIEVPFDDRAKIRHVSGQELVPVLQHDGRVIPDSTEILRYLDKLQPEPPLWPREPARRAEVDIFVDWFNVVWKRPPNLIADGEVDEDTYGPRITESLALFESLLDERDFLFGDELGAADAIAYPFLKYAVIWEDGDEQVFHRILQRWLRTEDHPRVEAWIQRVHALPGARR